VFVFDGRGRRGGAVGVVQGGKVFSNLVRERGG